ncbi:Ig-like domain-containing protein [Vibrio campbellii]|uniref:Ig-like domain-containing protein n=1 Tax=Vibrio campbellii TaxID=680 RepID=UPI00249AC6B4|nr:Ig-like domain-containing protein [Vibrio campbellii]
MSTLFKGLLALTVLPLLMLLSGCNSEGAFSGSETPPLRPEVKLERIDIVASPVETGGVSELMLAKGNQQSFEAVGYYSDGTSQAFMDLSVLDWDSSAVEVGRFDVPGVLTGIEVGSTTVTATKDGVTSNTVTVTVTDAFIRSIQVVPPEVRVAKGQTQQLTARAIYSDGTNSDVSDSVTWVSADTDTATVDAAGLLTGAKVGNTTVMATKDDVTSNTVTVTVTDAFITSIQVVPPEVRVAKGQTQQLTARAIYSDGTNSDVSDSVTWVSADTDTATVDAAGLLTGAKVGNTTVMATKDDVTSNTVTVTVTDAFITSIQVVPPEVRVAKGQTQQLTARAIYSDGTNSDVSDSVTWVSADTDTATVDAAGLLTGAKVGNTTVMATKDDVTSNTVNVTVTDAVIDSIQVTPSPVNIAKGQTQPLTARAIYSDGSDSDVSDSVTWASADTDTATVDAAGLLTGAKVGNTTVMATKDDVTSNTVNVTVTDAVIDSIQVTPSPVNIAKGQTQPLTARAMYSDGTDSDVTDSVTWASADTDTATVDAAGLLSAVEVGNTTLTATKDDVPSNTVNVTVTDAVIDSIQVTPSSVEIAKGQTQQLTARATYSDGSDSDVSDSVTWASAGTDTATVDAAGLLTSAKVGNTTVMARKDDVTSNTVNVTVTDAVIDSIQVTPSPVKIAKGQTQQLTARAIYSDGSDSDVSDSVTWASADTDTATVDALGLLSAVEVGNTTLTATKDDVPSNTVDVNVCADLEGSCIDIFDTGTGKLFTSSPSVAYLNSIGGSATNGTDSSDSFYLFDWNYAEDLCTTYNTNSLGGRTNWSLATKNELKVELYDVFGDMFTARGWPTAEFYWSATPEPAVSLYYIVNLSRGGSVSASPSLTYYVSCVSIPES